MPSRIDTLGQLFASRSSAGAQALLNSSTGGLLTPVVRGATYTANRNITTAPLLPDIASLLWVHATYGLPEDQLFAALSNYGVVTDSALWRKVAKNAYVWPDLATILASKRRGIISSEVWDKLAAQIGVKDPDAWQLMCNSPFPWDAETILRVGLSLGWDAEKIEELLRSSGLPLRIDRDIATANFSPPSPAETLALWNRGVIDVSEVDQWLALNGLRDEKSRESFKTLRHQIPSPIALIEFSVKEVWNDQIVRSLGYDDEFDQIPAFKSWMEKTGYGGSAEVPGLGDNQPKTWAQAYWRAHWRVISNQQAYTMLHRLRPTGGTAGGARVPFLDTISNGVASTKPVQPVTLADVENVLKINDYPPAWRDRLAAISYLPFRLVDIRRIVYLMERSRDFRTRHLPENWTVHDWAREQFMDRGQTREQGDILASMSTVAAHDQIVRDRKREQRESRRGKTGLIYAQYRDGMVDEPTARNYLLEEGESPTVVTQTLAIIDERKKASDIKEELRWLQRNLLKGQVSMSMATEIIAKIGLVPSEQQRWVNKWKLLLDEEAIIAATNYIVDLYRRNLVTFDVAVGRLDNLGWTNGEEILSMPIEP